MQSTPQTFAMGVFLDMFWSMNAGNGVTEVTG
jgi:hypothetical protein